MIIKIDDIIINSRKRKLNTYKVKELAESMKLIGQLEPITITKSNILLAGLHRVEAAKLLGWQSIEAQFFEGDAISMELVEIDENLMRNDLTILEQGEHLARRQELIGWKNGMNQYSLGCDIMSPPKSTSEIAKDIGLTERSAQRRMQAARNIIPEVKDVIRDTEIADSTTQLLELARLKPEEQIEVSNFLNEEKTIRDALIKAKIIKREQEIKKQKEAIESGAIELPAGKYDVIVIDPPWQYATEYNPETRRGTSPYPEMSLEEIKNIEIPAKDDCILWLWTTQKFIWEAKEILDHWGFEYKAMLIWDKEKMGIGRWLRLQCEFCLLGIKGKPIWDIKDIRDIIREPRREHSRKPEAFYKMIDENFVGRKLDYFSREKREGWEVFGNDTEKF